jgi:hypothetical protein
MIVDRGAGLLLVGMNQPLSSPLSSILNLVLVAEHWRVARLISERLSNGGRLPRREEKVLATCLSIDLALFITDVAFTLPVLGPVSTRKSGGKVGTTHGHGLYKTYGQLAREGHTSRLQGDRPAQELVQQSTDHAAMDNVPVTGLSAVRSELGMHLAKGANEEANSKAPWMGLTAHVTLIASGKIDWVIEVYFFLHFCVSLLFSILYSSSGLVG